MPAYETEYDGESLSRNEEPATRDSDGRIIAAEGAAADSEDVGNELKFNLRLRPAGFWSKIPCSMRGGFSLYSLFSRYSLYGPRSVAGQLNRVGR